MSNTRILFLDLATSGFSPDKDTILEVGVILADAGTFQIIDANCCVIKHAPGAVTAPDFHGPLLAECESDGDGICSMKATEGFLLAGEWQNADVICNRALDFDMLFLAKHMPILHARLNKNKPKLELKAIERVFRAQGSPAFVDDMPRTYRAGDEVIAAYKELAHYLGVEVTL